MCVRQAATYHHHDQQSFSGEHQSRAFHLELLLLTHSPHLQGKRELVTFLFTELKKQTHKDPLILTISLIVAGVVWFILVAEERGRQQEFPGQSHLFSSRLSDIHNLHLRVIIQKGGAVFSGLRWFCDRHIGRPAQSQTGKTPKLELNKLEIWLLSWVDGHKC